MTDSLTENGLQVSTNTELVSALESAFRSIYGNDINLDQNSPDGQLLNIFAQGGTDIRELLVQLYNSFDPDQASGRLLDERCAINNVFRKAGTFTEVDMTIVTDRTVTLQGLDDNYNDPTATGYTVQDNAGNQFVLATTRTLVAGTTTNVRFRAKEIGAVETTRNTITTPVTIVLGVISVNNPLDSTPGENEETDAELKIRRRQSVGVGASGYLNGLLSSVLQLDGVTGAAVYENNTSEEDDNGIPAHGIWLIVDGGSTSEIADTLYRKRNGGCSMKGSITYNIVTPSYDTFVARWDNSTPGAIYVKFNIQKRVSTATFDTDAIADYVSDKLKFKIGEGANTSDITAICQEAIDANGGNGYAVGVQISTNGSSWVEYIAPTIATKLAIQSVVPTVL